MDSPSSPGAEREERTSKRVERALPDLLRRLVESGYEKLAEGPESLRQLLHELRLPKETLGLLLSQLDETRDGLYRVLAREVREFLDRTSLTDEITRALTRLSFEIRTEVRFVPNDTAGRSSRPQVRSSVAVHRNDCENAEPSTRGSPGIESGALEQSPPTNSGDATNTTAPRAQADSGCPRHQRDDAPGQQD